MRCNCGHERSSHANGLWECKWCDCKAFAPPEVPDIFDDLEGDEQADPGEHE